MSDVNAITTLGDAASGSLRIFESARREIAQAETVDQVKRILAFVTGLATAARQATDREIEAEAAVLKLEAERRLGQLMKAQAETVGLATGGDATRVARGKQNPEQKPTLAQVGIDKNLAKRARTAAAIPAEKFEEAKEAKREAVLTRNKREPGERRKRKSRAEVRAEHVSFSTSSVRASLRSFCTLADQDPDRWDRVLDNLLGDEPLIENLAELARYPKVRELVEKAVDGLGPNGNAGPAVTDRELEIKFIGLQSENEEKTARIAELETKIAELEAALKLAH
jgi:hypothetical protein